MSLKEQITRTENLETKLKRGMTNINNVIVRGGGGRSTSVAQIPENITKMLGQYSKVAIGNYHLNEMEYERNFDIPINLDFNPTRIFILFAYQKTMIGGFADSRKNTNVNNALKIVVGSRLHKCIFIPSFNKSKITVGNGHNTMIFTDCDLTWIAIG